MNINIAPKWGIRLVALWASILALIAFATLLFLSRATALYSNEYGNQATVWVIFILNVFFGIGFAASSYGLWRQQNWGRIAFLWVIAIWVGFNLIALFDPGLIFAVNQRYTFAETTFNGVRYLGAFIVPLWYLNIPRIKSAFSFEED